MKRLKNPAARCGKTGKMRSRSVALFMILVAQFALAACSADPSKNVIHPGLKYKSLAQRYIDQTNPSDLWQADLEKTKDCCRFPDKNLIDYSTSTQFDFHIKSKDGHRIRTGSIWVNKQGAVTESVFDREGK